MKTIHTNYTEWGGNNKTTCISKISSSIENQILTAVFNQTTYLNDISPNKLQKISTVQNQYFFGKSEMVLFWQYEQQLKGCMVHKIPFQIWSHNMPCLFSEMLPSFHTRFINVQFLPVGINWNRKRKCMLDFKLCRIWKVMKILKRQLIIR